jgi:hypothetical protein
LEESLMKEEPSLRDDLSDSERAEDYPVEDNQLEISKEYVTEPIEY